MVLTVNRDKLFYPEKPPGSRTTYFRLSFEPCNFDKAVEYYNEWVEELKGDWYWTFSKKRNYGFDVNIKDIDDKGKKRKGKASHKSSKKLKTGIDKQSTDENNNNNTATIENSPLINSTNTEEKINSSENITTNTDSNIINGSKNLSVINDDIDSPSETDDVSDSEDEFIPTSIDDIVEVKKSTVNIFTIFITTIKFIIFF